MKIRILSTLISSNNAFEEFPRVDCIFDHELIVTKDNGEEERYPLISHKWFKRFKSLMKKSAYTIDDFYSRFWFTCKRGKKENLEALYQEFFEAREKRKRFARNLWKKMLELFR